MTKRLGALEIASLLDRYADPLAIYASQWTQLADDCVQEAFVELAKQPPPNNPVSWLYNVVRNRAINAGRSEQRRNKREQLSGSLRDSATSIDPSIELQAVDEQQRMLNVLESMPDDLRELIALRIWSELTWAEIAKLTNTSSSSAQRTYVQALELMKNKLETTCLTKPH